MGRPRRGGAGRGFTGAQPWEREWGPAGEIEIGWRLAREHWGKGYATAAALKTLDRTRAAGLTDVVALVKAANTRSIAVTRRLGMRLAETFTTPVSRAGAHVYRLDL
ncbi:Acetyltransferase (GNAT) domain-containing protein [Streptomyces sp. di188]|nr:Acetyltransferase (GNAT) domain-containing protein [Streptomyces sp. di50b]SCE37110.1 Acetyltransferase (GNAT) domain-containing protein [Streptomyces sp. di188]